MKNLKSSLKIDSYFLMHFYNNLVKLYNAVKINVFANLANQFQVWIVVSMTRKFVKSTVVKREVFLMKQPRFVLNTRVPATTVFML